MSFQSWLDLNDPSLIPPLGGHHQPDLGTVALMVSTAPDFRYIESNAGKISFKQPFFLANLILIEQDDKNPKKDINRKTDHISSTDSISSKVAVTGPYLGAPSAVMLLESLIARGVSKVVVAGWCGAVSDELQIGDILVPDAAICDEGASRNYMQMPKDTDFPTVLPSYKLSQKIESAFNCKTGKIWTTDAIYRETSKKIHFFRNMGAVAVEMECSALFAVANYRKIDIASILIVSDTLTSNKWVPGFKEPAFKISRKNVLTTLINIVIKNDLLDL
ncbi:MAG: nucleoside phosphorylase [Desulfamplus sp.]|nr:nucleoside phosphorylase [Desulfamplus sp.]